jgi:hypothetical protein
MPDKVVFQGKLLAGEGKAKDPWMKFFAIIKANNQILITTPIDAFGRFNFTFSIAQHKTFDLFVTGLQVDTCFIKSFTAFDNDTVVHNFRFPDLDRRKNSNGKVVCPKCGKMDKVCSIIFSEYNPFAANVDTTACKIINNKYYTMNSPNWYCNRDNIKFFCLDR